MTKNISSQPEASKFRSIVVIIIVLICIASFISFTDHLSDKAKEIARENVIIDIKYAISMLLYDYAVKGKQNKVKSFDRENPFVILAIYKQLPLNYHGTIAEGITGTKSFSWYFNIDTREAVYQLPQGKLYYSLRFKYFDENNNGIFDEEKDRVEGLVFVEL